MKQKLILLTVLLTALSAFATEYYVDASRPDDSGDGVNWATAKQTIQAAVDLTIDGDTVWVTSGTYTPITVTNVIFVRSSNGSDSTTIDGGGNRCAGLAHDTVLEGFTLTNGVAKTGGGVLGGILSNCVLSGNRACTWNGYLQEGCNGGGAYGSTLNHCTLAGNSANRGGGAYNCILSECSIYSNAVAYTTEGGWIYDYGQFVSYGGGVHSSTLERCVVRGNSAGAGGGGAYESTLRNCLIIGNTASGGYGLDGGGGASDCLLGNCTVVENQTGRSHGGGIFRCSATNSIIWSNISTFAWAGLESYDVEGSYLAYSCTPVFQSGVGNITNAPIFIDEANGNFRLQNMSSCVNNGTNQPGLDAQIDLDGNARIYIGTVDMGAYEAQYDKAGQWIKDFMPSSGKMISQNKTIFLSAQGGNSGNAITFTNLPGPQVVWVNSTTIQFSAVGDVYIVADQAGSSNYYSATPVTNHYFICKPGPFYVDASRIDDSGDGTTWMTAKRTIQAAVDMATDAATVWVTNGIYAEGGAVAPGETISSRVVVSRDITVKSVNGAGTTTIVGTGSLGSNAVRCAYLSAGAMLDGFTLTEGHTQNTWFSFDQYGLGETDKLGGGVFISGSAVVMNCVVVSNQACRAGGGAYCTGNGALKGCLVVENQAGALDGSFIMRGDGGGVYIGGGTMDNCTVCSNHTELGNAMMVSMNGGSGQGGGLYCYEGTINNCIMVNNKAKSGNDVWIKENSHPIFRNNAVNVPLPGQGNITNAPLFVDAANGDFRLQSNSPCINWGNNSVVSNATDLAGNPRIVEGAVDMGAYEYQGIIGLADSDADGINDDWERQHGGNQNPDTVCSNGVNTILQAYIAGLDPNDPQSKFQTSGFCPQTSGNELRWQGVSGRVYSVYYSTNLLNGFQSLGTNIPWTAGAFTDSVHNADGQGYYKIGVKLAP